MSPTITHNCPKCQKIGNEVTCPMCNATYYCSDACHTAHQSDHKWRCKFLHNRPPNEITLISCVKIVVGGPAPQYATEEVSSISSLFNTQPLLITQKFGYPLLIECGNNPTAARNEHATLLTIDPDTGYPRVICTGDAVIANADGTDLDQFTLMYITKYVNGIMNLLKKGGTPATNLYDRAKFDRYRQNQEEARVV